MPPLRFLLRALSGVQVSKQHAAHAAPQERVYPGIKNTVSTESERRMDHLMSSLKLVAINYNPVHLRKLVGTPTAQLSPMVLLCHPGSQAAKQMGLCYTSGRRRGGRLAYHFYAKQ